MEQKSENAQSTISATESSEVKRLQNLYKETHNSINDSVAKTYQRFLNVEKSLHELDQEIGRHVKGLACIDAALHHVEATGEEEHLAAIEKALILASEIFVSINEHSQSLAGTTSLYAANQRNALEKLDEACAPFKMFPEVKREENSTLSKVKMQCLNSGMKRDCLLQLGQCAAELRNKRMRQKSESETPAEGIDALTIPTDEGTPATASSSWKRAPCTPTTPKLEDTITPSH